MESLCRAAAGVVSKRKGGDDGVVQAVARMDRMIGSRSKLVRWGDGSSMKRVAGTYDGMSAGR